jgi:hypothetical protein
LRAARIAGALRPLWRRGSPEISTPSPGISVVIPSRNGLHLLQENLSAVVEQAGDLPAAEVIVVDNGSSDQTIPWLQSACPLVRTVCSPAPLSFACAVNRGISAARYSHLCLLNNDMRIAPGFLRALLQPFLIIPDLFCSTAQIHFPPGVRREETGKAVMAQDHPEDFPLRCDQPLPGEDLTWVLYGSGGCSLYDSQKLHALGNVDEAYHPAYVEDLDLGYRAWLRAWPTVYAAHAEVEHRHRATTSRYYSEAELQIVLEINYLKFLARSVANRTLFRRLWQQAVDRLAAIQSREPSARTALREAWHIALEGGELMEPVYPEELFLALTDGSVAVFPGNGPEPALVIATASFEPPPPELLRRHSRIVMVRGADGAPAHRAALAWTKRSWPEIPFVK